jgi:hypothetical protein
MIDINVLMTMDECRCKKARIHEERESHRAKAVSPNTPHADARRRRKRLEYNGSVVECQYPRVSSVLHDDVRIPYLIRSTRPSLKAKALAEQCFSAEKPGLSTYDSQRAVRQSTRCTTVNALYDSQADKAHIHPVNSSESDGSIPASNPD